jgi:pyrimidine-nucleoside phosphorylase
MMTLRKKTNEEITQKQVSLAANPEMIKLIEAKRQGLAHSTDEIYWMINNLSTIPDYQLTAWLMAVCINGLNETETQELTRAMAYSGHVLTLQRHAECDLGGPNQRSMSRGFVDKHSTGGVGDKVTIALAPLLASLGFKVSKFSGRSLGHTGGTVDKLEAIPGFKTDIEMKDFEKQIESIGICLAGQTLEFAPADKRLYSLRDRSGTVDSIPLIASSVMSKKIAGGADVILLDVKVGSGAFMKDLSYAKKLAKQMVAIGKGLNLTTKAMITNMDQPLGSSVGNGLEVIEAMECLEGKNPDSDFSKMVRELASLIASPIEVRDAIESGKAYVKLEEWVSAQGGDLSKVREANAAKLSLDIKSTKEAYVKELDALIVGKAVHKLAYKPLDGGAYKIDNSAGVKFSAKIGTRVMPGDLLFTVFGNDEPGIQACADEVISAYLFSEKKEKEPKLIYRTY